MCNLCNNIVCRDVNFIVYLLGVFGLYKRYIVHKPYNQVGDIFSELRASASKSKKSRVIYSIPCKNCDKQYIADLTETKGQIEWKYTRPNNNAQQTQEYKWERCWLRKHGNFRNWTPSKTKRVLEMIYKQVNNENVVKDKLYTRNLSHEYQPILRELPNENRRRIEGWRLC